MYTGRRQKIHFLMYTRNKGNEPTILQTLNLLAVNAICFPFRVRNTFPNLSIPGDPGATKTTYTVGQHEGTDNLINIKIPTGRV